jgi:C4-dicarboxylate-specific signal transduction histidine kinase
MHSAADPRRILAASLALTALVAFADYVTGYEARLAILYLAPVALATWKLGAGAGAAVAVLATASWLATFHSMHPYSKPIYLYWEGAVLCASLLITVWLLQRLRIALQRSDERVMTVLEELESAVVVEDPASGAVLYANRRFSETFGAGHPFGPASGELHDAANGRWYLVQSRSLRWIDGREALLRELSDVTDEHRARELISSHREAMHRTARLVALGEFASAIAHELNQPLSAIATYNNTCLRLLDSNQLDSGELKKAMERCRDQAKRAGSIIQRLREMLRHPVPAFVEQDLNEVAHAALELAQPEAREAGVALELAAGAALPRVRADRLLIEQVALNLVRNAIDAVHGLADERRRVTIATGVDPRGDAELCVADLGDGVPEEARERLFDAFVTTKPGGLGLGLAICRSVIEAHGGRVSHEPNSPRGTRFSFALPTAAA